VGTSTSNVCWLRLLTLSRPKRCFSRLNATSMRQRPWLRLLNSAAEAAFLSRDLTSTSTRLELLTWRTRSICICAGASNSHVATLSAVLGGLPWAVEWGILFEYIQPGKPHQNAYVERFNRTVRHEWLSQYHRSDLEEVRL
jgi:transposase InsO family protein